MNCTSQPISPFGGGRDALSRFFHLPVKLLPDGLAIQCHGVRSLLHHAEASLKYSSHTR